MRTKKLLIFALLGLFFFVQSASTQFVVKADTSTSDNPEIFVGDYESVKSAWEAENYADTSGFFTLVTPDDFKGVTLVPEAESNDYGSDVLSWTDSSPVEFDIHVPETGLYNIAVDFYSLSDDYLDFELALKVNDEIQYQESQQLILYKLWHNQDQSFSVDRYGNDYYGLQEQIFSWTNQSLMDPMGLYVEPLCFLLESGRNTITIERVKGELMLGNIAITGIAAVPDYAEYLAGNQISEALYLKDYEAEIPLYKNSSSIQAGVSRSIGVTPFSVRYLKLNVLSGDTYNSEREMIVYKISVPEDGYYRLTFKVLQDGMVNGVIFRTLKINGEIPFAEAKHLAFEYDSSWQYYTPNSPDGEDYLFHLGQGDNYISLQVDLSPYRDVYYNLENILQAVNKLSLDIRKLTGNQVDENRDWQIEEYLPDIVGDLNQMADSLQENQDYIASLSVTSKLSEAESGLKIAIRNLRFLAASPDEIPKNIALLATSTSSIASTLGNTVSMLLSSPLTLDKFYVHTTAEIASEDGNFFQRTWVAIERFFISFFDKRYSDKAGADELDVWINRPKQYVDLIQKMADDTFTAASGIKVKASVMASEGKLILANSANQNPDVALGVASWIPYDMGIRGAILDLTTFTSDPDFTGVIDCFQRESLIPLMYDEGLYGLPDTENFYVLFYRTDVFDALDIQVPDTWNDVIDILPILKRYGMNFYIPLSSATSLKAFDSTLPFLFQYGSDIYSPDAFTVNMDNEETVNALTMMTELYTIYSMDVQVTSFYNDFRLGLAPVGVGDFGMYITLTNAAPDIQGLWKIALMPGVEKPDGSVDSSAPGAQTANMIFQNSAKQEEGWEFLKWWTSTTTQSTFASMLLSTLGKEYMWNSANLDAFKLSNLNASDIQIVLEQWSWLRELPKVPGSYQVELEISNLWNSVVLDRTNLRVGLNDGIIQMNKEIQRKMAEFGYMDKNGNILKPYRAATLDQIEAWIAESEANTGG